MKSQETYSPSQSQANQGYITISIVLVVMAVVLGVVITVSQLGLGEGQSSLSLTNGESNLHLVEGCMEDALLKLRANAGYSGGTLTRPEGSCSVTVSQVVNDYTITTTSTTNIYKRTIQARVTRAGSAITITSWKEL